MTEICQKKDICQPLKTITDLRDKLIQGNVVLDVFRNELPVFRGNGFEVGRGEGGGGVERGESFRLDDVPDLAVGDVGFEEIFERREVFRFLGFVIGDEFRELFFEQLVLRLEARDEAEDFFEDFAQAEAAVHGDGAAKLVEGVEFGRLVEDFAVHVVDDAIPLARLHCLGDEVVFPDRFLEAIEEHPVDLHAVETDGLYLDGGNDVVAEMLVAARARRRRVAGAAALATRRGLRQGDDLIVIEFFLEVFAVGEEIEEFVRGLFGIPERGLQVLVEELVGEVVFPGAAPLDLDEVGGRKNGAEETEVENVRAVVAGGHHADGNADAGFAGFVGFEEVGGTEELVVGEIDGELLRVGNPRGDLNGEVGLVFSGKHPVRHFVEDLGEFCGVVLADGEDDGFSDFAADGIAQGVFQKRFAEQCVGFRGEEALLELALMETLLAVLPVFVGERDDEAIFGKQLRRHAGAGIDDDGIDEIAVSHAIQQRVAEGGLAVLAAEGAIGVEQQAALGFAGIAGGGGGRIEVLEVVLGRGGEAELVADEVFEDGTGVSTDGTVGFIGNHEIEVGRGNRLWYLLLKRSDWTVVTTISAWFQSLRLSL